MFDWLRSTIGSKPDHPMHDVAAAQALLQDLPQDDGKATDEIASWLETVTATEGFDHGRRLGVVKLLDETGQNRLSTVSATFLSSKSMKEFERLRLWQLLVTFWENVANAYGRCLAEMPPAGTPDSTATRVLLAARALVAARALRALATEAKYLHFRYLPVRPSIWQGLSGLYSVAEQDGLAENSQKVYARDAVPSTPRQELLRALMLDLSLPESERAEHIELASRVIARLAVGFSFSLKAEPGCNLYFDLARPERPAHCPSRAPAGDAIRYFGAGRTRGALQDVIDRRTTHPDEPERRFGDDFSVGDKVIVAKHLLACWADAPPRPVEPSVKMNARVRLAHGFNNAHALVTRVEFSGMAEMSEDQRVRMNEQTGIGLAAQAVDVPTVEWVERDATKWGIGVDIPREDETWATIGTLCTFQPAGRHVWWIGVIRRLYRDERDREHASVEIVAKKPVSVWLRGLGEGAERADNWATSSGSFKFTYANALLLGEGASPTPGNDLIVARERYVRPGTIFEVMIGDKLPRVRFDELLERGEDFDRVRVNWLDPR